MSFILESIKQAERDRKLGQQKAPEISIEYTSAHVDDIESNKKGWLIFLTGLTAAAILMWSAAYYLTNKDRQYIEQLSVNEFNKATGVESEVNAQDQVKVQVEVPSQVEAQVVPVTQAITAKQNTSFAPVSVKKLHTSDLKSVKLITEQEKAPVPRVVSVSESRKIKQPVKNVVAQKSNQVAETEKALNTELPVENKSQVLATGAENVSSKQELAKIYADLASLDDTDSVVGDLKSLGNVEEQPVQLKTANYVVPKTNTLVNKKNETAKLASSTNYSRQHEQAVNSGVPSFGELPYDIQERIPDFNVSVHMFHVDPMQRRIRINGQMYTEGKSLQQDLALVEITRYGAVFDYQGNLFRFNVR